MARAIRLAAKGLYTTDPNPRVGCLLVRDGEVVGEGWHRRAGGLHAERIALIAAGERARGATAYVTLEPCCHHGKTPPCTDALVEAGVTRVVIAMKDPNPLVSGNGMSVLRSHGVQVASGLLEAQARALNPGFVKRMVSGLPHVRCKLAASLDGRTAMASGESKWITSPAARLDVQRLRARSSAIVTGIGTVLADDPSLNVRLTPADLPGVEAGEAVRQPVRVVADNRLRMPTGAKMLSIPGKTIIACAAKNPERAERLEAAGAIVHRCSGDGAGVDLQSLLRFLGREEINEILIEAGPTLAGAAVQAGLVDELVLYLAPHLMGDAGRGLFHLPGLERMSERIGLEVRDMRMVGTDLRITAFPQARAARAADRQVS